jgi:adenine-specific DNA-methyltransferase
MDGQSQTPHQLKLKELQKILPEAFTEGKVDWDKLKATLGEDVNLNNERYVLNWAGKSEAFKTLQMPTANTLIPCEKESINFDKTNNIFIEGENLEALKILQKSYYGKVKMIYIDPPYNTGNDSFIYPDKFSQTKASYQTQVGDKDQDGNKTKDGKFHKNRKENGQYHSNWLNMMYPRLFLAKNLLRQDGVIFISIDDNEVHNLRLLMNEVFGEENFVAEFTWKRRASSALADKNISMDHEYVICYQKGNLNAFRGIDKDYSSYSNPDNDKRGDWTSGDLTVGMTRAQRPNQFYNLFDPATGKQYTANPDRVWAYIPSSMEKLIIEGRILFPADINKRPMMKRFKNELKSNINPISTLLNVGMNSESTKEFRNLFLKTLFSYGKPLSLIKTLLKQVSKNGIVLDFFTGSATTAHAVMALNAEDGGNRQCISIQLPELCDEKSEAYKAGYKTIADIAKERIRRAAKKIQSETKNADNVDLGFKVFKLSPSNFKQWQPNLNDDTESLKAQLALFVDPIAKHATTQNMVVELLLKSGKSLNSKIDVKDGYHIINDNEIVMMLETVSQTVVEAIIKLKPQKVIALDRLFKNNDELKTNTALQMNDADIEFKTL